MSKFKHTRIEDKEHGTWVMLDPYFTPKECGLCVTVATDFGHEDSHVKLSMGDAYALRDALVKLVDDLEDFVLEQNPDTNDALTSLISKKGGDK
jgi:hypothetical protein